MHKHSGEQRKKKFPGTIMQCSSALGFGFVTRSGPDQSGAGNRERINFQGQYCNVLLLLVSALSHGAGNRTERNEIEWNRMERNEME